MEMAEVNDIVSLGMQFEQRLDEIKRDHPTVQWYPYRSLTGLEHLQKVIPQEMQDELIAGKANWDVVDIGAADGELGLYLESRGAKVDYLERPATNYNGVAALNAYRQALGSEGQLFLQDVDLGLHLDRTYSFALALGLLYHLRNPMDFLVTLAHHAERMVLSTRVCTELPDGTDISKHQVAYFLRARESNNDPTNFWVFSPVALEAVLKRSGWIVKASTLVGAAASNPVDVDRDMRMFVYAERTPNWADLNKHHDF